MERLNEYWTAAGVIIASITALGGGVRWFVSRREERRSREQTHEQVREANELARRVFEADTIPQISIDIHSAALFMGYGTLREGSHNALRPPDPWTAPIPKLVATVKNQGKVPVRISKAGIRLERTGEAIELHGGDVNKADSFLMFPVELPSRDSFNVNIDPVLVKRMLGVLHAQSEDQFTVWVEERIETRYFSPPQLASDYLLDAGPFLVAINFESPVTVTQIGEEEYFPEGIVPSEPKEDLGSEPDKKISGATDEGE